MKLIENRALAFSVLLGAAVLLVGCEDNKNSGNTTVDQSTPDPTPTILNVDFSNATSEVGSFRTRHAEIMWRNSSSLEFHPRAAHQIFANLESL